MRIIAVIIAHAHTIALCIVHVRVHRAQLSKASGQLCQQEASNLSHANANAISQMLKHAHTHSQSHLHTLSMH